MHFDFGLTLIFIAWIMAQTKTERPTEEFVQKSSVKKVALKNFENTCGGVAF